MDLRARWVIARQDHHTEWEFFADRGAWTRDLRRAVHFYTLWGAEEARAHSAGGHGDGRNAADVCEFAMSSTGPTEGASMAANREAWPRCKAMFPLWPLHAPVLAATFQGTGTLGISPRNSRPLLQWLNARVW